MSFRQAAWVPLTICLSISALILGIPVAVAALFLEKVYVPHISIGKPVAGNESTQMTAMFLTSANDAVIASAYIPMITYVLFILALIGARHTEGKSAAGRWAMMIFAWLDVLSTTACLVYVLVFDKKMEVNQSDMKVHDRQLYTNGQKYTEEAWSCFLDRVNAESLWAGTACKNMGSLSSSFYLAG